MINLKENFSCSRDSYGWKLISYYDGLDRKKNHKRQFNESYYANLDHLLNAVIDIESGKCESLEELKDMLKQAREGILITEKLKSNDK